MTLSLRRLLYGRRKLWTLHKKKWIKRLLITLAVLLCGFAIFEIIVHVLMDSEMSSRDDWNIQLGERMYTRWLHLAHGVRGCAAGLRYVLYLYMTAADEPWRVIAEPAGYLLAPLAGERVGDVSNVLFSNGWIADDDGTVYIYYASSDTRMHVAVSTVDRLVDYCLHTPADGLRSAASVAAVNALIDRNEAFLNG